MQTKFTDGEIIVATKYTVENGKLKIEKEKRVFKDGLIVSVTPLPVEYQDLPTTLN